MTRGGKKKKKLQAAQAPGSLGFKKGKGSRSEKKRIVEKTPKIGHFPLSKQLEKKCGAREKVSRKRGGGAFAANRRARGIKPFIAKRRKKEKGGQEKELRE